MNLEDAKEFYKDIVFRNMEDDEAHNIFTNYNNFSRDHFVMEKTFEECWKVMELLNREKEMAYASRDMYAKKAYAKEPAMVAINKQKDSKMMRYMMILLRKYEKSLKDLGVSCRDLMNEASDEMDKKYPKKDSPIKDKSSEV